jgi:hypothetical protein
VVDDSPRKCRTGRRACYGDIQQLLLFRGAACPHPAVLIAIDHCGGSASEAVKQQTITDFSWSAWAGTALRPNLAYSYANNWSPEPLVGNHPTADAIVWSVLSRGRELLD